MVSFLFSLSHITYADKEHRARSGIIAPQDIRVPYYLDDLLNFLSLAKGVIFPSRFKIWNLLVPLWGPATRLLSPN